jgi:hypothetical protein
VSELVAHVLGVVNAELDKLERCFSWTWVREHLVIRESKAINPDRDGYERIAAVLNRAFAREMLKNERPSSHPSVLLPAQALGFHLGVPGGWSHGDAAFKKQRRWHDHVWAMAEAMKVELELVNGFSYVDVGYSKDGPIVRALVDVIPIITGEHPGRDAIAKKLERS